MLEIHESAQAHFDNVKVFAERRGLTEKLQVRLDWLGDYACHGDTGKTKCILYRDFAPYSFEFVMLIRNKKGEYERWFNGGLIYFGKGDTGVDTQLSVRFDNSGEDFEIHT